MIRTHKQSRRFAFVSVLSAALLAIQVAGCGDDDGCCAVPGTSGPDPTSQPAYAGAGPYPVGVTTLELADRKVEVWYPAVPGSETGVAHDTYRQTDPLTDPILKGFAENIARRNGINLVYETRGFRDLPASGDGPFPVVIFSHGFGGWRNVNSSIAAGIAAWGYVVASAEYLERGLNAVAISAVTATPETDNAITLDTLALLAVVNNNPGSVIGGIMNFGHKGIIGHSAGGRTALDTLAAGDVDVAIGYAAAGGATNGGKPVMLIAARNDIGVTTTSTEALYASLSSPKRLVIIEETGHNSFSDICTPIRDGASLAQLAREAGLQIDERLLALAEDGCSEEDLAPEDAWSITQHFSVAELRATFGTDDPAVGLGPRVADEFITAVEYRQD